MTDPYTCERCGYKAKQKYNLCKHLNRKTACAAILSNIDCDVLLAKLESKEGCVECRFCNTKLKTKWYLKKHEQVCGGTSRATNNDKDVKSTIGYLVREVERLKRIVEEKQGSNNTINGDVINNNNINIVNLNNFGNESSDHITQEQMTSYVLNMNQGVKELVKNLHFNPEVPENRNIRLKSDKKKLLERYVDGQWLPCDKNNTLDELISKGYRILYRHYTSLFEESQAFQEREEYLNDYFAKLGSRSGNVYYQLRRDLYVMIHNNTLYVVGL